MRKFLLFLCLIFLIAFVNAANITSTPSKTSIEWNYSEIENIQNATIDSIYIENFNPTVKTFVLSGLKPNETHIFHLITNESSYSNISTTLPEDITEQETTFSKINIYIYFVIALVCLIISAWVKPVAWIALLFSLIGIIQTLDNTFNMALIFVTLTLVSMASLGVE